MSDVYEESLKKHAEWKGKIETKVDAMFQVKKT